MKKSTLALIFGLTILVLSTSTVKASDVWFWIPSTNLPQYPQVLLHPEQWNQSENLLDTYVLSMDTTSGVWQDSYLKNYVIPLQSAHHIKIAIDSGNATWLTCRKGQGTINLQTEVDNLKHFYALGGTVDYIWMQSSLSKPVLDRLKANCPGYSIDQRLADIITYMKAIHQNFPAIKIGLIDNTTTHMMLHNAGTEDTYQNTYRKLMNVLKQNGQSLDFLIEDVSSEQVAGKALPGVMEYPQLLQVEQFVHNTLQIKFGLILATYDTTASEAKEATLNIAEARVYKARGGNPDFYVATNHYAVGAVTHLLPENDSVNYTATKYLLAVEKIAKNIAEKPGDLNGDGKVDILDYNTLLSGFGTKYTLLDYNTLVANFGK